MDWIVNLFTNTESVAHIALLYAIVIAIGVYLGKLKIGGISLGVTFVLFAGILAGHVGFTGPKEILTFVQDFGLILFVFMIGLQVGPGFFESFKKGGVTLNMLSASAILLNILVMFGCYYLFFDTSNPNNLPMMVGTLYGAVTNTPGLGAANEALLSVFPNGAPSIANGYACAYPLGVVGIIGATILIKYICKINTVDEEEQLNEEDAANPHAKAHNMHLRVENAYITGRTLREVSEFLNRDIVCSRLLHNGEVSIPNSKTKFEVGDELLVVCAEADAEAIKAFIGPEVEAEWDREKDEVQHFVSRRIIVTRPEMNGKTLGKMHFSSVYGVNVTRISRQGMDIFAGRNHHFHVGDKILVVGPEENVNRDPERAKRILRSLARNQCAQITINTICADLENNDVVATNRNTVASYIEALKKIFVLEDSLAWNPNLRSKTAIRTSDTRYFSDPSIGVAALGIGPNDLVNDLSTMGLFFESMCIRDLRVYADAIDGTVYHYRDGNGLECDAVVHLRNGNYGLIEVKLGGEKNIEEGAKNLKLLASKIDDTKMKSPSFLMVLTGTSRYAVRRDDGVYVVPIGCLKD